LAFFVFRNLGRKPGPAMYVEKNIRSGLDTPSNASGRSTAGCHFYSPEILEHPFAHFFSGVWSCGPPVCWFGYVYPSRGPVSKFDFFVTDDGSLRVYDLSSFKVLKAIRGLGAEVSSVICVKRPGSELRDAWIAHGQKVCIILSLLSLFVIQYVLRYPGFSWRHQSSFRILKMQSSVSTPGSQKIF